MTDVGGDLRSSVKFFTFKAMQNTLVTRGVLLVILITSMALGMPGQSKPVPKTFFYDSDGNEISNNEFVDIRVANPHYPDRTIVKTLDDGTVVFRLQKVPQEGAAAPVFSVRTLDG